MTIYVVENTTSGAPGLSGVAGSLIAVLDFCLVTIAGWSKVFSGTTKAVYRAPTGSRMYLRVDDSAAGAARVVGYESMSDVDTGTGLFPTSAQFSGGLYIVKSSSADSVSRPYLALIRNGAFHLSIQAAGTTPSTDANYSSLYFFGDFTTNAAVDVYCSALIASESSSHGTASNYTSAVSSIANVATTGTYICRSYTQSGTSIAAGRFTVVESGSVSSYGASGTANPNPITGKTHVGRIYLTEGTANTGVRGHLPGIFNPLHAAPLANRDTFTGSGDLVGRTLRVLALSTGSARVFLETSDTWD